MKPDSGDWDLDRLWSTDAPELQRALDAARQRRPDPQQLAALAASLSQKGISVAPSKHATATTASSATRLKLLLGVGIIGPITLALLLWRPPAPHPIAPTNHASPTTPTGHAVAPSVETAPAIALNSSGVSRQPAPPAATDATRSSPPVPSSKASVAASAADAPRPTASSLPVTSAARVAVAPTTATESARPPAAADRAIPDSVGPGVVVRPTEVALLRDARLALGSNPTEALALAERHRVLFARGAMVQERELIAISALARLGRHTAVLARAAQFERDFPSSPYRKQVSALAQ